MYKEPMDKAKGGYDSGWEVQVGGAWKSSVGKMGTTVTEQQKKKEGEEF